MKKIFVIALFCVSTLSYAGTTDSTSDKKKANAMAWKATGISLVVALISKPKSFLRYLGWGFVGLGTVGIIITSGKE